MGAPGGGPEGYAGWGGGASYLARKIADPPTRGAKQSIAPFEETGVRSL